VLDYSRRRSRVGSSAARPICATTQSIGTWLRAAINLHWCGSRPRPDQRRTFTYRQLHDEVNMFAAALAGLGVGQGDRVLIYMPMTTEAVFAMLAVVRLGAIHSVVFGGFAASSLAARIDDAKPR
jgi:propionyl-CoA synthetase